MYPTKEEILANLRPLDKRTVLAMRFFKDTFYVSWRIQSNNLKLLSLKALVDSICILMEEEVPDVKISHFGYSYLEEDVDEGKNAVIYLGPEASILSTLHELGHHLYGPSELDAQVFAVSCYKIINPTLKGLQWKGHLLVQTQPRSKRKTVSTTSPKRKTAGTQSESKQKQAGT